MKKNIYYFTPLLILLLSLKTEAQTTTTGYWTNPINQVPFIIVSEDSLLQNDTLIIEFNGEPTTSLDSIGNKVWNNISDTTFRAIFGYNAILPGNPLVQDYYDLFTLPIDTTFSQWDITEWDSLIANEPWIDVQSENLSSADMGSIVAWGWDNMSRPSAQRVLDPTVPIIDGIDMDYAEITALPGNVTMALDFDNIKTNVEEIQAVNDQGIYTFNKTEFKDTYEDFVEWMITTKPFFPKTFNYSTYHEWLYEFLNPIAHEKIEEILSTPNYMNEHILFQISQDTYQLSGEVNNTVYNIFDTQGKRVKYGKLTNDQRIHLSNLPKGIYIVKFEFENHSSTYKITK